MNNSRLNTIEIKYFSDIRKNLFDAIKKDINDGWFFEDKYTQEIFKNYVCTYANSHKILTWDWVNISDNELCYIIVYISTHNPINTIKIKLIRNEIKFEFIDNEDCLEENVSND